MVLPISGIRFPCRNGGWHEKTQRFLLLHIFQPSPSASAQVHVIHKKANVTGLLSKLVHRFLSSSPSGTIDLVALAGLLLAKVSGFDQNNIPILSEISGKCWERVAFWRTRGEIWKSQGTISIHQFYSVLSFALAYLDKNRCSPSCRSWAPQSLAAMAVPPAGCAPKESTAEGLGGRKPPGRHPVTSRLGAGRNDAKRSSFFWGKTFKRWKGNNATM